jgi:hypothetical protein
MVNKILAEFGFMKKVMIKRHNCPNSLPKPLKHEKTLLFLEKQGC